MTTDTSKFTTEYLFGEPMSYEEARNQEILTTGDDFFAKLDEMFGIVPGTDRPIDEEVADEPR